MVVFMNSLSPFTEVQLTLRNDPLKRSFCKDSEVILSGYEEVIPEISLEKSIALSRASAQYYVDSLGTPRNGVEIALQQDGFVFAEANSSVETKVSDNPDGVQLYKPIYSADEKAAMLKAYRLRPHIPVPDLLTKKVELSPLQFEVLYGLLCGNGYITETKGSKGWEYRFHYYDSIEKTAFVEYVFHIFSNICGDAPCIIPNDRYPGGGIGFSTLSASCFEPFYKEFYPDYEKSDEEDRYSHCFYPKNGVILDGDRYPPNNMDDLLTPRALAFWFMGHGISGIPDEDGFKPYGFLCPGHESGSIDGLVEALEYRLNIQTNNTESDLFPTARDYVLEIAPCSYLRFKRIMLHFIHPSLLYLL